MSAVRLATRDREMLAALARASRDARGTRRALALLDLDAGEPASRVARRYQVGRSTVCEWAARWADTTRPRGERLRDAARSGHPPGARDGVQEALAELMPTAPTEHGYRHPS